MVNADTNRIKLERTEETLTGQGGFLALLEYVEGMRIGERVTAHLPAPGSNRGYDPRVFVQALTILFAMGGRTLSDLRELEREKALLAVGGLPRIPDEDTVGDWLRRMGDPKTGGQGLAGLRTVVDETNLELMKRDGSQDYTLDPDATFIPAEKETAQYSYLKEKGYMPMMAALYENGLFIDDEFREGNESPQNGHVAVYRRSKALVEKAGKRIARYRADSASYQAELINVLEEDGVHWTITADQNSAVRELIDRIPGSAWVRVSDDVEVAETVHAMKETPKAFRLLVKRTRDRSTPLSGLLVSYRYWAVATNFGLEWTAVRALEWHQLRGGVENFHKGLKSDVGVGYMPTGDSPANAVWFRIGVLVYNLIQGFKRDLLPVACQSFRLPTLRWKFFALPGKLVRHARTLVLKLAVPQRDLDSLSAVRAQCRLLFQPG